MPEAILDKPTMRERLVAWWEGYDPQDLVKRRQRGHENDSAGTAGANTAGGAGQAAANAEDASPPMDPEPLGRHGKPLWTATRLEVAQFLWGRGFVGPGSADYVPDMVRPVAPSPAMSMLELAAGLGGVGRTVAKQYGAWVTCLETSPLLARRGMELSVEESLDDKAPVKLFDPMRLDIGRRYDCVLAKEAFVFVPDKEAFLKTIVDAIKPRGQLLFTDYVIEDTGMMALLQDWCAGEPLEPFLISEQEMTEMLEAMSLDVRIADNITPVQDRQITTALNTLKAHLAHHSMDERTRLAVTDEVELWASRAAAFRKGLRLTRFHAIKP